MPYIGNTSQKFVTADDVTVTDDLTVTDDAAIGGDLAVTGIIDAANFKIGGAQGTDGQVITSTGSGVAFENAGGGLALLGTHTVGNTTTNRFTMSSVLSTSHTNYLIVARNMYTSTDDDVWIQLEDASGVLDASGTYDRGQQTNTNTYGLTSGAIQMAVVYCKRASGQIVPSDFVLNLTTNNISGSHKVTIQGEYYWSQANYWFTVSGNIRATNSATSNAYSGTPSGLSFKVQGGSNYFLPTATVRIYGYKI